MTTRTMLPREVRVLARFATVGVASNALLYLLYLVLSVAIGLQPVVAATIGWIFGVGSSFLLNQAWTFEDSRPKMQTFIRYVGLYATAYVLNMVLLVILVDRAGLPHEAVQGLLIVILGLSLFLGQRFWVFPSGQQS